MYSTNQVLLLAQRFAGARKIETSTLGRHAVGNSHIFERLGRGRVMMRTVDRLIHYLSIHWPENLDWPVDIPRPSEAGATEIPGHLSGERM